jgi:hypothetical protein
MNFIQSAANYESWLRSQLKDEFVEKDLKRKHQKMADGPFPFLRATYWRWAETILDVCPELADSVPVLAVGDIHLENYGTWRDADGRLVWGVNDFDEATEMPYATDLVRLATSAALADQERSRPLDYVCGAILEGYERGLDSPRAQVLDHAHAWLREIVEVKDKARDKFWEDIEALQPGAKQPRPRYVAALHAAFPEPLDKPRIVPRQAGAGSLGRPRWVAVATWRSARLVREVKVLVPSAWNLPKVRGGFSIRWNEIATGRYRAPDPWFRLTDNIVVRRLSPNNRKIEAKKPKDREILLGERMLKAMGRELSSIHLGSVDLSAEIGQDLRRRKRSGRWLVQATEAAVGHVLKDFRAWCRTHSGTPKKDKD